MAQIFAGHELEDAGKIMVIGEELIVTLVVELVEPGVFSGSC